MKCPYASSGCNYPEGECLGVCYADARGGELPTTYAAQTTSHWPMAIALIALVLLIVIGAA